MTETPAHSTTPLRDLSRWALAIFLVVAGTGHLVAPDGFLGQVPRFLPWRSAIVLVSGVAEVAIGLALALLPRYRVLVGWATALFFVVVFPGNIWQAVTGSTVFGLDSDAARWGRLAFQPLFVLWALWSTAAWRDRGRWSPRRRGHPRATGQHEGAR